MITTSTESAVPARGSFSTTPPDPRRSPTTVTSTTTSVVLSVTAPPPPPVTTVEDRLRSAILDGDVEAAAAEMNVGRTYAVGGGLRVSQDLARRLVPTRSRNSDPDVVVFKVAL